MLCPAPRPAAGATSKFGHPEPTQVRITPKKGKAILISGHDLQDTYDLLAQTEGTGVNVWTHGELLPAHGYPALKKRFPHLVGWCVGHGGGRAGDAGWLQGKYRAAGVCMACVGQSG